MRIKMRIEFGWLVEQGMLSEAQADAVSEPVALRCYESAKASVEQARPVIESLAEVYPLVFRFQFLRQR